MSRPRPAPRPPRPVVARVGALVASIAAAGLASCVGSSEPRRPEPPQRQRKTEAEARFRLLGARDSWHDPLPVLDGLRRTGGVREAYVDEATGKYVVVYDPRRTHIDRLRRRVREIGRELGRDLDPLFDSR